MLRHLFTDDPRRQAGGITEGLVVLLDDSLKELWGAFPRQRCAFRDVRSGSATPPPARAADSSYSEIVEADVEGVEIRNQVLAQQRHQDGGVDTSREKCGHRDVALQMNS